MAASLPKGVAGVSSCGRVQSKYGIINWGSRKWSGYHVTAVGGRTSLVHRLVARAFLGPPPSSERFDINHKDGDRSNNSVWNLEYTTRSENIQHSYKINPDRRTAAAALSKPVIARRLGTQAWTTYPSGSEAGRQLLVHSWNVSACCRGRLLSSGGFEFQFAQSDEPSVLPSEEWRPAQHPETGATLTN